MMAADLKPSQQCGPRGCRQGDSEYHLMVTFYVTSRPNGSPSNLVAGVMGGGGGADALRGRHTARPEC